MAPLNDQLLAALTEKLGTDNPKMQLLSQLLAQQQLSENENGNDKRAGQVKKLAQSVQELKKQVAALKKQRSKLVEYLDFFINVNAIFASAVGACECWGGDDGCEKCRGKGKPGYYVPNQEAFQVYVQPSLKHQSAES